MVPQKKAAGRPPEKGQPAAVRPVVLDHGEGHARIGQDGAEVLQEP